MKKYIVLIQYKTDRKKKYWSECYTLEEANKIVKNYGNEYKCNIYEVNEVIL